MYGICSDIIILNCIQIIFESSAIDSKPPSDSSCF